MRHHSRTRLHVEALEGRDVPAQFSVPWNDAPHLTLSFAPDGTDAGGVLTSELNTALDAQLPRATWREAIIRAARTWAEAANINIGIVGDDGSPFGAVGQMQADPRFGDIRIGAVPMAEDALGQAIPPDPLLVGSYAGDVFFNTNTTYTATSLYSVALHEIGHALGMPPSTNKNSVMFNVYGARTKLAASDISGIRTLYGTRPADRNEGLTGNKALKHATDIPEPSSYDGETPLIAFGEISGKADIDSFRFDNPSDQTGPVTIRVQTAGISTLVPRLTIYNKALQMVTQQNASNIEGDTLTYNFTPTPGERYYLRIDDTTATVGNVGRYGIAITFDELVEPTTMSIDEMLRGPHDTLDANDIAELFEDPNAFFDDADDDGNEGGLARGGSGGGGSDDGGGSGSGSGGGSGSGSGSSSGSGSGNGFGSGEEFADLRRIGTARYSLLGSIEAEADEDDFLLRAPKTTKNAPVVLTVFARGLGANGITPAMNILDENENAVAANVLVNGDGMLTIQATGLVANRRYTLEVTNSGAVGNYALEAVFGTKAADITTFSAGTLDATSTVSGPLYVARTQLFAFSLGVGGTPGTSVTMTIKKGTETVFTLTANAGETLSAVTQFLTPGEYTVQITATGDASYELRGAVQSDPLGPRPSDSTLAPVYPNPNDPKTYLFPNGQVKIDPFLFALLLIR